MIKTVEFILNNQACLFVIGCALILVPAMGIMFVHTKK